MKVDKYTTLEDFMSAVKKQPGFLYFLDKQGDVSCAKMVRGGKRKKKKK